MTAAPTRKCLVVVPTLDEAAHVGALLDFLLRETADLGATVAVVDGGSTDGTREIVLARAATDTRIAMLHNRARIQSVGVNLAARELGAGTEYLVRVDAHGGYPDGYVRALVAEADRTGAASVVVSMRTKGSAPFQKAVAVAQNSRIGNGGAAHRVGAPEGWTDHGHHALFRTEVFSSLGGYDETFAANEDAEYDRRLVDAGHRVWLTSATSMDYFPRSTPGSLFGQYLGYGAGRARNAFKHRTPLRLRQSVPLLVAPAVGLALLAPASPLAAIPAAVWAVACVGLGALGRDPSNAVGPRLLAGPAAMVMHLAWSLGFYREATATLLGFRDRKPAGAPEAAGPTRSGAAS